MLGVEGRFVRTVRAEIAIEPFFQEGWVGGITGTELHLPIARKEMLVLPEKVPANLTVRNDVNALLAQVIFAIVINEIALEVAGKSPGLKRGFRDKPADIFGVKTRGWPALREVVDVIRGIQALGNKQTKRFE